ncbi:hypothetical protein H6504_04400 [Candidatus Woesearchaeota archaeon]|nr:hypothetical protein [Candidatus Woesearchaeota archaeon]
MRLTKEVRNNVVREVVGEDVLPVMEYLLDKENISEFKIAEALDLEVNRTRNILYRMYTHNIVTYHRKKDRIKGWYISYWTLNLNRIKQLVTELKRKKIEQLKDKLTKEAANENLFFLCPNMCIRADFDRASTLDFRCPECGNLLAQQDNSKTIENIQGLIEKLEGELADDLKTKAVAK